MPAIRSIPSGRRRMTPLAHAIALALTSGGMAISDSALAQQAFSPAWFANKGAVQGQVAATGRLPNGQSAAASTHPRHQRPTAGQAQQSIDNLNLAARAIAARQAAQAAARAAAVNAASDIPNGLVEGGLVVDADSLTAGWLNASAPVQSTSVSGRTQVSIEQTAEKAILNWQTFNVGANTDVVFDQQGNGTWVALNRVNDPQARPSQIAGQIQADGSVYIINRNGIVFTGSSQVNVGGLTASALNIVNERFLGDIVTPRWEEEATFAIEPEVLAGNVSVEAGARIETEPQGQVLLFGGEVENAGTIRTPGGQTLLAAGNAVYLKASTDATLRGYLAEVDGEGVAANHGDILAERGNVTLVGKDVVAGGRLGATTGVAANGSVTLHARHATSLEQPEGGSELVRTAASTGTVSIEAGAVIDVLPDLSDTETVAATQLLFPSTVEAYGNTVVFGAGSTVVASGGVVDVTGIEHPELDVNPGETDASRIYVDAGAVIDVSGTRDVALSVARNFIEVELRGNELRDNPLLRDSPLYGQTVWIDVRDSGRFDDPLMQGVEWFAGEPGVWYGSALFDASGYIGLIRRGIGELTSSGGAINLSALGDIVVRDGATLDVSGGTLDFAGGFGQVTRLFANDSKTSIGAAQWGRTYDGIVGAFIREHARWGASEAWSSPLLSGRRWQPGYIEGQDAGTVKLNAPRVALDGLVAAHVDPGTRPVVGQPAPVGGTLILGDADAAMDVARFWNHRLIEARIQTDIASLADDFSVDAALADDFISTLSTERLAEGGVGRLQIHANDTIEVTAGTTVDLGDASSVTLIGNALSVEGGITAHGGEIVLATRDTYTSLEVAERQRIGVGSAAVLDVSGRWVNDFRVHESGEPPTASAALDGGSVTIHTSEFADGSSVPTTFEGRPTGSVQLAAGSVIDVSGGGYVSVDGDIALGDAGAIDISSIDVTLDAELRGYALATPTSAGQGGSLSLTTRQILIGGEPVLSDGKLAAGQAAPRDLALAADVTFVIGESLPFDVTYSADLLLAGERLTASTTPRVSSNAPVTVAAAWVVPEGMTVRPVSGATFTAGQTVPAGTQLSAFGAGTSNGTLPAGFTPPPDVFPNGIPLNSPAWLQVPQGTPLGRDYTIPSGATIAAGTVLDRTIEIIPPTHLASDFFREGGFANHALNGHDELVVVEGTQLRPAASTRLIASDARSYDTGATLADLGQVTLQDVGIRPTTNLSLDASRAHYARLSSGVLGRVGVTGALSIGKDAVIAVDPGSAVSLTAAERVTVAGTVQAPGGSIHVAISRTAGPDELFGSPNVPFSQDRVVRLTPDARLLAPGSVVLTPNRYGLRTGEVLDGGTVAIDASWNGYVVTEAGSLIDVSGTSAVLDILDSAPLSMAGTPGPDGALGTRPTEVWSDAGSVRIAARDGGYIEGSYRAERAHSLAGGGSFTLVSSYPGAPDSNRSLVTELTLHASGSRLPEDIEPGADLATGAAPLGELHLAVDTMLAPGFDDVTLSSDAAINFEGDIALTAGRQLRIDSPVLRGIGTDEVSEPALDVSAPYVALGNFQPFRQDGVAASVAGPATLTVQGELVDLAGNLHLQNIGAANIRSTGDVRLVGVTTWDTPAYDENGQPVLTESGDPYLTTLPTGSLSIEGVLTLDAAQIYPTIGTRYAIEAIGEEGSVILHRAPGADIPAQPFSAGASLIVQASSITQGGVLRVPFGQITLDAGETGTVTLMPGSVTSVSGDGLLLPYGRVENGESWTRAAGYRSDGNLVANPVVAPPAKRLTLSGETVDFAAGAVIDANGGGELLGVEFVPGTGGSRDILASQPGAPVFAVLPGYGGPTPVDLDAGLDSSIHVGDSAWLSGVPGLTEGYYTLLPGQYAMLPGAYRVTLQSARTDVPVGANAMLDGSWIVGGYLASSNGDRRDARTSQFRVMPGSVVREYTEYVEHKASEFFSLAATDLDIATPRLPGDAGQLVLDASSTLQLNGTVRFDAEKDGRGGIVDIVAESIAVVKRGDAPVADYGLTIDGASLSELGAESLLLGGKRSTTEIGTVIDATSERILIANDEASALLAPEVVLVARASTVDAMDVTEGEIVVASGAVIRAEGTVAGDDVTRLRIGAEPQPANATDPLPPPTGSGNGAALIVSNAEEVRLTRVDRLAGDDGVEPGRLTIDGGALLESEGALVLDATGDTLVSSDAQLVTPSLEVASSRIGFGEAPDGVGGLVLDNAALARLGDARQLTLRSYSTIDLHGAVTVGGTSANGEPSLGDLVLDGVLVRRADGNAIIRANSVTLSNVNGIEVTDEVVADGTLTVAANSIGIGDGVSQLLGYGAVAFQASTELTFSGDGGLTVGSDDAATNVTVTAGRIAGGQGATQYLVATGDLTILPGSVANAADNDTFGASLMLAGRNVHVGGAIDLPSGELTLNARNTLTIDNTARLSLAGREVEFFDQARYVPAGDVTLIAQTGNVNVLAGAVVDVSAGAEGKPAGSLDVQAPEGTLQLAATVTGGSFSLDASTIENFSNLNQQLNDGGFADGRSFRIREGDVVLDGATRTGNLSVMADSGSVMLAAGAVIDANGAEGGSVRLVAADDLTLESGATILARGSEGEGGEVDLIAGDGELSLRAGALIDVSGVEEGGNIHLRASRDTATSGFRLTDASASLIGAERIDAEAVWTYDNVASLDVATLDGALIDAASFMAAEKDSILASFGRADDETFHLLSGIEFRSASDMTVAQDLDLAGVRPGGEAGVLTLRAAGTLHVNESINDGFDGHGWSYLTQGPYAIGTLRNDESWSYRLVGGADTGSADPLAVQPVFDLAEGVGDVALATNVMVRTGTGDIDLAAGRDIVFTPARQMHLYNPADPTQVIPISEALGASGSALPHYRDWRPVESISDPTLYQRPAVVYTAGRVAGPGEVRFSSVGADWDALFHFARHYSPWVTFADEGGDLRFSAQGDITGASRDVGVICASASACFDSSGRPTQKTGNQFVSDWLLRQGQLSIDGQSFAVSLPQSRYPNQVLNSAWAVDYTKFRQGVGTLGGGDVEISAGGRLDNMTVVASHSGWLAAGDGSDPAARATSPSDATLLTYGGGDVSIRTGADAAGNLFYVGQGQGTLRIGGDLTGTPLADGASFDTIFALADARFDVTARGDIDIGAVFNPTLLGTIVGNTNTNQSRLNPNEGIYFSTYTEDSALHLHAVSGDIRLSTMDREQGQEDLGGTLYGLGEPYTPAPNGDRFISRLGREKARRIGDYALAFNLYPATLEAVSFGGDIAVGSWDSLGRLSGGSLTLLPAADGNLTLLAAGSVNLRAANGQYSSGLVVSDADPARVPGILDPATNFYFDVLFPLSESLAPAAGQPGSDRTLTHASDLYRKNDSDPLRIYARDGNILFGPTLFSPKSAHILAGLDIIDLNFAGQHFSEDQVTVIQAGRDLGRPALLNAAGSLVDRTAGGGAGASVILGGPGRLEMTAGRDLDLREARGIETVGNQLNQFLPEEQGADIVLTAGAGARGPDYAGFARAYLDPASQALPEHERNARVREAFYEMLAEIGEREAPKAPDQRNYNDGYDAIATLFPETDSYDGNVSMRYSQVKTVHGGDIDILVPGGRIDAGQTVRPRASRDVSKTPDQLGITTVRGGDISVFVDDDMAVNSSRVFTLGGGGILIWSSNGDIDAGKGAKTALLAPPPRVVFDPATGTFDIELSGEAAGSGIGTLLTNTEQERGNVWLIAPRGRVDAGDAGIRVAGNLIVAAREVRGVDNIQVDGLSFGVPVSTVNVSALTDVGAVSAQAASAAQDLVRRERSTAREALPSIFSVRVLGFGSETTQPVESERTPATSQGFPAPPAYDSGSAFQVLGQGDLTPAQRARLTEIEQSRLER